MLDKISEHITNRFIHQGIICNDERDIYQFGFRQLLEFLLSICTLILLGVLFSRLIECLIFSFTFMSLRIYAGGYHASTRFRCYIMTVFVAAAVLSVIKYLDINILCCIVILALSASIILGLSPVESKNKKLDNVEKLIYRRKSIKIWSVEVICAAAGLIIQYEQIAVCIMAAHMVLSISLIISSIQESYMQKKNGSGFNK